MTFAILVTVLSVAFAVVRWLGRCRHEPMLTQRRDSKGKPVKPHTVDWVCFKCRRIVGTTQLVPRFRLLAQIYRDRRKQKAAA